MHHHIVMSLIVQMSLSSILLLFIYLFYIYLFIRYFLRVRLLATNISCCTSRPIYIYTKVHVGMLRPFNGTKDVMITK